MDLARYKSNRGGLKKTLKPEVIRNPLRNNQTRHTTKTKHPNLKALIRPPKTIFIYHFTTKKTSGIMVSLVESDGSGRIVIPKRIRDEFGIKGRTQFLLSSNEKGEITLQKIDVEEMASRLREELKDVPVEALAKSIRKEINDKIRSSTGDLPPR